MKYWQDKPYNTLNAFCKKEYGEKIYKVSFDIGLTCPNRDGKIDTRGCIFCSAGGSGEFSRKILSKDNGAIKDLQEHLGALDKTKKYIGYFQAFTNTYGEIQYIKSCFETVIANERIVGISIGTRPDCIDSEIIEMLDVLRKEYNKFVWIELGFQTMHNNSIKYIRRGYENDVFEAAINTLKKSEIPIIVHLILGLPYETKDMMLETVRYINNKKPFGVKLQLLHVLSNTDLANEYIASKFLTLTQEEYIEILINTIELLDQEIVVHRVTGDGDKNKLIAPKWSTNKKAVLNELHKALKIKKTYQGKANEQTKATE